MRRTARRSTPWPTGTRSTAPRPSSSGGTSRTNRVRSRSPCWATWVSCRIHDRTDLSDARRVLERPRETKDAGVVSAPADDLQADRKPVGSEPTRNRDRRAPEHGDRPARRHPVEVGGHWLAGYLRGELELDRERRHLRDRLHQVVGLLREEPGGVVANRVHPLDRARDVLLVERQTLLDVPHDSLL